MAFSINCSYPLKPNTGFQLIKETIARVNKIGKERGYVRLWVVGTPLKHSQGYNHHSCFQTPEYPLHIIAQNK